MMTPATCQLLTQQRSFTNQSTMCRFSVLRSAVTMELEDDVDMGAQDSASSFQAIACLVLHKKDLDQFPANKPRQQFHHHVFGNIGGSHQL